MGKIAVVGKAIAKGNDTIVIVRVGKRGKSKAQKRKE
jgi:hypothetical protein